MTRHKYYPPRERQYLYGKALQCVECGNTNAFAIDLRIPYRLQVQPEGLNCEPDQQRLEQIFQSLGKNLWTLMDRDIFHGEHTIRCANCQDGFVDFQERLHDLCFHYGCPGCDVCGQYISEAEVKDICSECLLSQDGQVTEEDCVVSCPWTVDGLGEVREHHGFTLDDLKTEMGY